MKNPGVCNEFPETTATSGLLWNFDIVCKNYGVRDLFRISYIKAGAGCKSKIKIRLGQLWTKRPKRVKGWICVCGGIGGLRAPVFRHPRCGPLQPERGVLVLPLTALAVVCCFPGDLSFVFLGLLFFLFHPLSFLDSLFHFAIGEVGSKLVNRLAERN